ncbi:MAG: MFS transporter [Deltaproteobacteria bacterium]|nr:MFS transporter [Deltaproteobacteria bacterium]
MSLRFGVKLAYGVPSFAIAVVGVPMFVYLPRFYSDVVGVSVTTLGVIVLAGRAIDAFTDPFIGWASDRTRTRFGRRRPWIAVAAPLLAATVLALYLPPEGSETLRTVWCAVFVTVFFLLLTGLVVPYRALGPELVRDFDDRNTLFSVREGLFVVGSAVAMAGPPLLARLMETSSERARFAVFAAIAAPLLLAAAAACVVFVREPTRHAAEEIPRVKERRKPSLGLGQRPFAVLLAAYTIAALGNNLPGALATYYATYVLGVENVGLYLVAFLAAGLAALPLWNFAARRFGKKQAWLAALAVNTVPFACVFPLGRGDTTLFAVLVVLSGLGAIATVALAPSMQADAIDHDELVSGERRDGQLIGLWMIAEKLAAAIGVGVALPLLGAVGYRPNVEQTPAVLLALRILYVVVPCVCNALAFVVLLAYPIDRAAHVAITEALAQRRSRTEAP